MKQPKKPTRATKCVTCKQRLGDGKSINCQLCIEWVCLPCAKISEELYNFCEDNDEAMAFLCQDCKLEIPELREMKCIRAKQLQIETELHGIQDTVADANTAITDLKTSRTVHGQEIAKHEEDLKTVFKRLQALESAVPPPPETTEGAEGIPPVT